MAVSRATRKTKPGRREPKAVRVASEIRQRIATGELQPGDALPSEAMLMERHQVSQPTMRAALRILENDGLLSVHRGAHGGPRVEELRTDVLTRQAALYLKVHGAGLLEMLEALEVIQPGAVALAAQRRTPAQLAALRACVERVGASASMAEFSDASADFVLLLLEASGNVVVDLFARVVADLIRGEVHRVLDDLPLGPGVAWNAARFAELVDLIEARQADGAAALWRAHLVLTHPQFRERFEHQRAPSTASQTGLEPDGDDVRRSEG